MLNDLLRAHHAGLGKWGSVSDMNSCSIGIEIDNNGSEPFTEPQMNSLLQLLDRLKKAYNIPQANLSGIWTGHREERWIRAVIFRGKHWLKKGFGFLV
jgi:N-acetylmuramoyl-L-alanine amidase